MIKRKRRKKDKQKKPDKVTGDKVLELKEKENTELLSFYDYTEVKEGSEISFGNGSTIRNFGESKGLNLGTNALAVESTENGYIIYVDKKNYNEAVEIYETNYKTNVVVKLKEDMSKDQGARYGLQNDGFGIMETLGKLDALFRMFGTQVSNPCQYNCEGKSYININNPIDMENTLGIKNLNSKLSLELGESLSKIDRKGEASKVVIDEYGNTHKVKDDDLASGKVLEASKNSNLGNNGNTNVLKPQDISLTDFTQKGGKIDNFAEGIMEWQQKFRQFF